MEHLKKINTVVEAHNIITTELGIVVVLDIDNIYHCLPSNIDKFMGVKKVHKLTQHTKFCKVYLYCAEDKIGEMDREICRIMREARFYTVVETNSRIIGGSYDPPIFVGWYNHLQTDRFFYLTGVDECVYLLKKYLGVRPRISYVAY